MSRKIVVSTIGISLFLNAADEETRRELNRQSNQPQISQTLASEIEDDLLPKIRRVLRSQDPTAVRRASAELNSLYGLYQGQMNQGKDDLHFLIGTDTDLSRRAASLLKDFLKSEHEWQQIQEFFPQGLSTRSKGDFEQGIQNLLRWCEETLPGYKQAGYRIVFNLTASFKSLQGYLTIIGMFYADEIAYIFEGADTLLRIPRLPIEIAAAPFQEYAPQMEIINAGFPQPAAALRGLPEGLVEADSNGLAILSEWGLLVWNRLRQNVLSERLLDFPNLTCAETFQRDFKNAEKQERVQLQATLAKVSAILSEKGIAALKADGGLQYDNYTHRQINGKPIGHFRVSDGGRVSCLAEGNTLILRHFGAHDYVNNNP